MAAELEGDSHFAQQVHIGTQPALFRLVGRPHERAPALQKACGGDPGAGKAYDQNVFAAQIHAFIRHGCGMRPRPPRPEPGEGSRPAPERSGTGCTPCYLNFRVLMAISARAMAMIQNRTMTLGSGQPFNSK